MSNDTAECGCEGHFENFSECKYPSLLERVRRLEEALRTIAKWDSQTFPRVPDNDDPTKTWSYGAAYGSNGERDFMRNIAREALLT